MHMVTLASEPGALDLFWFPMSIFVTGMILTLTRNPIKIQKMGIILAIIGTIFVAISPFTLPDSPSSSFGQLILLLLGPTILLIFANLSSIKNNKNEYIQTFFMISALSWIVLIWIIGPQFNNSGNDFWLLWVISIQIVSTIILFSQAYLEENTNAKILFLFLGISILLLNEEKLGLPNASRSLFIESSGTISGAIVGFFLGLIIWFYTIQKLHSLEDDLKMDKELTLDEKNLLLAKLNNDLEWIENFEGGKNE